MKRVLDFLIVGTGPLGSALRAAILGSLATTLGRLVFEGWWQPLILGIVLCSLLLPLAYMISSRDDQHLTAAMPASPPLADPAPEEGQFSQHDKGSLPRS